MNAHGLLTSQGWLGSGHALDARLTDYGAPTYKQKGHRGLAYDPNAPSAMSSIQSGHGLVKPLLISQRHTRHGIGKKTHEPQSGNEWWLKGFATALNNIGKSESERTSAATSGTSTPVGTHSGKHGGLYGYFVKGQLMQGSLEERNVEEQRSKKRKSDVFEESQDPLAVLPVKRQQTAKELEDSVAYLTERDRERKKAHNRIRNTDIDQFALVGQFLGGAESAKMKCGKENVPAVTSKGASEVDSEAREETKEQRRARRKLRKEKKSLNLSLAQMVEEELAKLNSTTASEIDEIGDESEEDRVKRKPQRAKKKKQRKKEDMPG